MSFHHRGWLSGRYKILFLLPGDIKKPIINWMIYCHPSIFHILILIPNTATFLYGLQYPTVYLLCCAISLLLGILSLSNYSVHCISPVDRPTDVSNWYHRSHCHRSNQNLNIITSSFFTSTTKAYYQSMIADLLHCELARLTLYHLLIPHGDNCRRVFVPVRWLLYMQYPEGWLLYPLPQHLSYLPIYLCWLLCLYCKFFVL